MNVPNGPIQSGLRRLCFLIGVVVFVVALDVVFHVFRHTPSHLPMVSERLMQLKFKVPTLVNMRKYDTNAPKLKEYDKSKGLNWTQGRSLSKGVLLSFPEVFRYSEKWSNNSNSSEAAKVPSKIAEIFSFGMTRAQYRTLIELLYVFDNVTKENGMPYFLGSGSLLGSWRCHCLLQWDDDMDFLLDIKHRPKLLKEMQKLAPKYTAVDHKDTLIKFYKTSDSSSIPHANWRWPFLDISFYREDGQYIRETNPWWKHQAHRKADIFPLVYRPYEGLAILAPHNPLPYFTRLYGNINKCATQKYSHRLERNDKKSVSVSCEEMKPYHPFVKRTISGRHMTETIMFGDRELYTVFMNRTISN